MRRRRGRGGGGSRPANSRKRGDSFSRRARQEGFAARSVYKLKAIDERRQLLRRGQCVLDLGCHPGSWLAYVAKRVGPKGYVLGLDLQPTEAPAAWAEALTADVYTWDAAAHPRAGHFDALLSDMAPKTTGIKAADHARSVALVERALELACVVLRPGGFLLTKVFAGGDLKELERSFRAHFGSLRHERPPAVRRESKELYLLAQGFERRETEQTALDGTEPPPSTQK